MAEAVDLKLDTIKAYNKMLKGMAKYKMTSVDGFLWNAIVVPRLSIDENKLKAAYEMLNKVYHITYMEFCDSIDAKAILQWIDANNKQHAFAYLLKQKINKTDRIEEKVIQWPFKGYSSVRDSFMNLNENEVLKIPNNNHSFNIIYVNNIENTKIGTYNQVKDDLKVTLEEIQASEIANTKQKEIMLKSRYDINNNGFSHVLQKLMTTPSNDAKEIEAYFKSIAKEVLFSYITIENKLTKVTIEEFNDYYFFQPIRNQIKDSTKLIANIENYIIDDYF